MKKYSWKVYRETSWARDTYLVSFIDLENTSYGPRRPLPKRSLINKLKVLMTCPVSFKDDSLGRRTFEEVFQIYDYNKNLTKKNKWKL